MTGYDVFAIVVILFSVAAGWVRGGVREVITLLSATLAALVAAVVAPATSSLAASVAADPVPTTATCPDFLPAEGSGQTSSGRRLPHVEPDAVLAAGTPVSAVAGGSPWASAPS